MATVVPAAAETACATTAFVIMAVAAAKVGNGIPATGITEKMADGAVVVDADISKGENGNG